MTADSKVISVDASPDSSTDHAFALIPSQIDPAKVYLNQQLPSCGYPPPLVTVKITFDYEFTGDSTGCIIGAAFNRETTNVVEIVDDGTSNGVWQHFEGPETQVQLTTDPLFTIKLNCAANTANTPGILITNIHVYP
jgi:hypothetical protein